MNRVPVPVAIAVGSIVGVFVRWGVFDVLGDDVGRARTVLVNGIGCLLMGLFIHRGWREDLRAAVTIGVCGGLTTFSTFALDTSVYLDEAAWRSAAIYVLATAAVSAGTYVFGRRLMPGFR